MITFITHYKAVYCYTLILLFPVISFAQDITTQNGVRYIKNGKLHQKGVRNFELQLARKYGGLDLEINDIILYKPMSVVLDKNENLVILDFEAPFIKIYDSKGQFVTSFGNKGQGPGEFMTPVGLDINTDGYLYVAESNSHICILSRDGEYMGKVNPKGAEDLPGFRLTKNGSLLCSVAPWLVYIPEGSVYENFVIKMLDQNGSFIKGFGKINPYDDQTMSRVANGVAFSLDAQDNIYVTYRYQNRIEKYSPEGNLLISISRKLSFPITENPKAILKTRKNGVIYGVDAPIMNIVSCGIGIDENGRIWVMTFSRQPEYMRHNVVADGETNYTKLEIFNQEGILTNEIPLKDDFSPSLNVVYIKGKRLFLINRNDASVLEYRIEL